MGLSIPVKLLLSLIIGAVIGLERESYEHSLTPDKKNKVGALGIRTFSLVTLLGCTAGLLYEKYLTLSLLINITFMLLVLAYYILGTIQIKDNGLTTEVAIIFSYLLGTFISLEILPVQIIVALTVMLVLILSYKDKIRKIMRGVERAEVSAFISFALISLVILPFLPDQEFSIAEIPYIESFLPLHFFKNLNLLNIKIINPHRLWLIVALITGLDLITYFLEKITTKKNSWLLVSLVGGFVSSTVTIRSFAKKSMRNKPDYLLVSAAMISNLASFYKFFILVGLLNSELFYYSLTFYSSMFLSAAIMALIFLLKNNTEKEADLAETKEKISSRQKIFAILPALKFSFVFLAVKLLINISHHLFGQEGLLVSSALTAISGLDALVLTVSEIAGHEIELPIALLALLVANTINMLSKIIICFKNGSKEFYSTYTIASFIIILASFLSLVFTSLVG